MHKINAPLVHGGGKARQIPDHAAAERNDAVRARYMIFRQKFQQIPKHGKVFGRLPVREYEPKCAKAFSLQASHHPIAVKRVNDIVGHDHRRFGLRDLTYTCPCPAERPCGDADGIAPARLHFNILQGPRPPFNCGKRRRSVLCGRCPPLRAHGASARPRL